MAGQCPGCRGKSFPFRQVRAAGIYEGVLRAAIHSFKYQKNTSLLPYLQQLLQDCLEKHPLPEVDLVIPVPLHRSKEWERGFNQAALLARGVARHLQRPVDYHSLVRKYPTPPTSGLSRRERRNSSREPLPPEAAACRAKAFFWSMTSLPPEVRPPAVPPPFWRVGPRRSMW